MSAASPAGARLARIAPGLAMLVRYRPADFPADLKAGLAVAAVAIPVAIAYAELAGFSPVVGLYSSILPLVAYAIFGSSRQLIVGPDAPTCALIAAAVAPLALGDATAYAQLSVILALLTGLMCVAASFLRLGALADFLSRPILVGFLNGVALTIILGQLGKLIGVPIQASGIVAPLVEVWSVLDQAHPPSLAIAALAFAILILAPRVLPWLPAAILAIVACAGVVAALRLDAQGVRILGDIPAGLPLLSLPRVDPALLPQLIAVAGGLTLVSFSSLMITARSFAAKNGYVVDPDRDLAALGVANVASALAHGFAVSGADSRTAVADSTGGRSQVTGLVAAAAMALVLLFLTGPIRWIPTPALGAVLVMAGLSLLDWRTLVLLWRIDRLEALLSVLATLGVVLVGAVDAILVVVVLALLRFIRITARPKVEILGEVADLPGLHALERHTPGRRCPGVLFLRFNGPIVFFNAPWFRERVLAAVDAAGEPLHHLVLDLLPVTHVDATGVLTVLELEKALAERGITLATAYRATELRQWAERHGFDRSGTPHYPTLGAAVRALRPRPDAPAAPVPGGG